MPRQPILIAAACAWLVAAPARAQSGRWEIVDNSFLIEEAFNQEPGVFQNIFTWTRTGSRTWDASFTQEWPAPNLRHQLSYTIPFSSRDGLSGINDVLLNYRYQLLVEGGRRPAVSPRVSLILPSGRKVDRLGSGVLGVQVNVPASKQLGDLYVHANAGWTWLPGVDRTPRLGGSLIWRLTPMFNVLLEALAEIGEATTVSPGFRRGWNLGAHQLVVGAAAPIVRADGATGVALLTYVSYELPFR